MKRMKLFAKRKGGLETDDVSVNVEKEISVIAKVEKEAETSGKQVATAVSGDASDACSDAADASRRRYSSSRESQSSFSAKDTKARPPRRASSAGSLRDRKLVQAGLCLMFSKSDALRQRGRMSSTVSGNRHDSATGTKGLAPKDRLSSARARELSVTSPQWADFMVEKLAGDEVHEDVDVLLEAVLDSISGKSLVSATASHKADKCEDDEGARSSTFMAEQASLPTPQPSESTPQSKTPRRTLERKRAMSRALKSFRQTRSSRLRAITVAKENKDGDSGGSDDDVDYDNDGLENAEVLTDEEYLEIRARVRQLAGTKGYLDKMDCKSVFGIKDEAFLERIVELLAEEEEGGVRISVERFTEEVSVLLGSNNVSKLNFIFRVLDKDGNGHVSRSEFTMALHAAVSSNGIAIPDEMIQEIVNTLFAKFGSTADDFSNLSYPSLRKALKYYDIDTL